MGSPAGDPVCPVLTDISQGELKEKEKKCISHARTDVQDD